MARAHVPPTVTREDLLDELQRRVCELVEEYRARLERVTPPAGSRTLAFAVEAGLPVKMAYTVSEAARITGVSTDVLRAEHEAGRLAFVMPKGQTRYFRVMADELDRWMRENTA